MNKLNFLSIIKSKLLFKLTNIFFKKILKIHYKEITNIKQVIKNKDLKTYYTKKKKKITFKLTDNTEKKETMRSDNFNYGIINDVCTIPNFEYQIFKSNLISNYKINKINATYLRDYIVNRNAKKKILKNILINKIIKIENGICINSRFSSNYIHFMLEYAPIIFFFIHKIKLKENFKILLNKNIYESVKELVKIINNNSDNNVILMKDNQVYKIKNLWLSDPSFIWGIEDVNLKNIAPYKVQFDLIKDFREYIIKKVLNKKTYPEKIYINFESNYRKFINQKELIDILIKNNYFIIDPLKLTFKEQMNYFFKAKKIISCWGAANANLLFSNNSEVNMIVINEKYSCIRAWSLIKSISKFNLKYYLADKIYKKSEAPHQSDFAIDINNFIKKIKLY
jgi:capsular polysaccharide biosynthesis protein